MQLIHISPLLALLALAAAQEECLRDVECSEGNTLNVRTAFSASQCRDYCVELDGCKVYTFYGQQGLCRLLASCGQVDGGCAAGGCQTGLLDCQPGN